MMTTYGIYQVISFMAPLYISMFIGYASVKWWKLFKQEHCLGIRRFCSLFAVPILSFHYITKTNLCEMNLRLFTADVLQKVIVAVFLACWFKFDPKGSIEQLITIFSICTLPNALILGIQIIRIMYQAAAITLVVEIFLVQSVIWHPLLLIMYEYRAARLVISHDQTTAIGGQGFAGGISSTNKSAEEVEATNVVNIGGGEGKDLEIHIHSEDGTRNQPSIGNKQGEIKEVPSTSMTKVIPETEYQRISNRPTSMPSTIVTTKQIMIMVWKKLIGNPNTYAVILGLVGAVVLSNSQLAMPQFVARSVTFLSNASLGMGMFNMGLSLGLQPAFIPCSKVVAALTMVLRFIIGPIVMAFASLVVGIRGTIFRIAVVQAAVSQGIVSSVFAVQYNVYPEIFSVGMLFGMVVALPVTLLYYNLFEILG